MTAAGELEDAAAAGEILLGEDTERLIRGSRRGRARSRPRPGRAWRVLELRPRAAGRWLAEGAAGRPQARAWPAPGGVRARAQRRANAAPVHDPGDGGIGKSRLAQEFAAEAAEQATVVVGRCVPYGEGITFWSLREIVAELTAGGRGRGVARRRTTRPGGSPRASWRRSAARRPRSSARRSSGPRGACSRRSPRVRPLVVFFEDVHWAEPTFLDLVEYLAERTRDAPILLVCIARPELLEQRPDWSREKCECRARFDSSPLPDADCEALIGNLAPRLSPRRRRPGCCETAEGNPLFIEQLVADAHGGGSRRCGAPIPPTIDALLSARLDRLGPGERAVISRAAIVGKEFSAEATLDLLPEDARAFGTRHLETLVQQGVHRIRGPTAGPGAGFRFRHILIQEAAYRATPKTVRAELHERFADWVGRSRPRRARRALRGRRLSPRAGVSLPGRARPRRSSRSWTLAHRASEQLATAGQQAFKRGDMPATVNLLGRAAALPTPKGGAGLAALPELGYALFETGEVDEASAVLAARSRAGARRRRSRR